FRSITEVIGQDDPEMAERLREALAEAHILHASVYTGEHEEGPQPAALVICALPFAAEADALCCSLARHEAAQGHHTTLATLTLGPAVLSVADDIRTPGESVPWQLARYRAWILLRDRPIVLCADLATPKMSGWEVFGNLMAGILISMRIHEGDNE
ncbi:MAG: hypothetical protein JO362_18635, partial [Streptomycetaceae bacterium]|nr:hypothetical protein [Streptomycetaceae bacterium]